MSSFSRFLNRRVILGTFIFYSIGLSATVAQSRVGVPEAQLPQLDRLIDQAIEQSPRMLIRNANAAASEADLITAKAARLPNIGGSASWVQSREDRGDFSVGAIGADKLYYNFSINQPLYQWGNIARSIKSAEIRQLMDEGRTRQAYLMLANEVRLNYLSLIRQRRNLESVRFDLKLANEKLTQDREKRAQNIVSDADVFQSELNQQRAEYMAILGEDSFIRFSEVLARLSGTEPLSEFEVPLEYPAPQIREDAPVIISLLAHFMMDEMPTNTELELALQQLEINKNDLHRENTALRPSFSLIAGASLDEQSYDLNVANKYEVQSFYAGVSMYWNIFNGFANKGRVRSTLARMRAAETEVETKRAELITNAQSYGRQFKGLALAIVITDRELDSAKNGLADMSERMKRGEASQAQVDAAQGQLHSAYGRALAERGNYWEKLGDFLSLIEADPVLNRVRL